MEAEEDTPQRTAVVGLVGVMYKRIRLLRSCDKLPKPQVAHFFIKLHKLKRRPG